MESFRRKVKPVQSQLNFLRLLIASDSKTGVLQILYSRLLSKYDFFLIKVTYFKRSDDSVCMVGNYTRKLVSPKHFVILFKIYTTFDAPATNDLCEDAQD